MQASLATQLCYPRLTASPLSSPLGALSAPTRPSPPNTDSFTLTSADSQIDGPGGCLVPLRLMLFSYRGGVALLISTTPLISLQQLPQLLNFTFFYLHRAKPLGCLVQLQQRRRQQQGAQREARRKPNVRGRCATTLLRAQPLQGVLDGAQHHLHQEESHPSQEDSRQDTCSSFLAQFCARGSSHTLENAIAKA